jgi:hypothetical protein
LPAFVRPKPPLTGAGARPPIPTGLNHSAQRCRSEPDGRGAATLGQRPTKSSTPSGLPPHPPGWIQPLQG